MTVRLSDREKARRVVEKGRHGYRPGTGSTVIKYTPAELEYLRWLGEKVQREEGGDDA